MSKADEAELLAAILKANRSMGVDPARSLEMLRAMVDQKFQPLDEKQSALEKMLDELDKEYQRKHASNWGSISRSSPIKDLQEFSEILKQREVKYWGKGNSPESIAEVLKTVSEHVSPFSRKPVEFDGNVIGEFPDGITPPPIERIKNLLIIGSMTQEDISNELIEALDKVKKQGWRIAAAQEGTAQDSGIPSLVGGYLSVMGTLHLDEVLFGVSEESPYKLAWIVNPGDGSLPATTLWNDYGSTAGILFPDLSELFSRMRKPFSGKLELLADGWQPYGRATLVRRYEYERVSMLCFCREDELAVQNYGKSQRVHLEIAKRLPRLDGFNAEEFIAFAPKLREGEGHEQ
jgi:hypothetical protein